MNLFECLRRAHEGREEGLEEVPAALDLTRRHTPAEHDGWPEQHQSEDGIAAGGVRRRAI